MGGVWGAKNVLLPCVYPSLSRLYDLLSQK